MAFRRGFEAVRGTPRSRAAFYPVERPNTVGDVVATTRPEEMNDE